MIIYYAPKALDDLQNVKLSVIETFYDEELADEVVKDILASIRKLEIFPYAGPELEIGGSTQNGYRYLFCRKNYVFYRVEDEYVHIIRVLNEKQEFIRILYGVTEE